MLAGAGVKADQIGLRQRQMRQLHLQTAGVLPGPEPCQPGWHCHSPGKTSGALGKQ